MMGLLALSLVLLGVVIGGAGLKRAGRLTRRLVGPWRTGLGGLSLIAIFGGAALAARGSLAEGGALAVVGLVFAVSARRRSAAPVSPPQPEHLSPMGEAEARQMLGIAPDAGDAEIDAAYRRLMKRVHPDHGGAAGLAAQLNAARAALRG
jgi:hypothetical protein